MPTTSAAPDREPALLSQADIARLARVSRPVVSMWVSRHPEGAPHAFPSPVRSEGQRKLFTRESVARWLGATGLGNNPDAARDALAHCAPRATGAGAQRAAAALLTLSVLAGTPLVELDAEDLRDLADEVDPDDEFLRAEIEAMSEAELEELAPYVDARVAASTAASDELRELELDAAHFGTQQRPRELSDAAAGLVRRLTSDVAGVLGPEGEVALAARRRDADVLRLGDETWVGQRVVLADAESGTDEEDRAVRRRVEVTGADSRPVVATLEDPETRSRPCVQVCTFAAGEVADAETLVEQIEHWAGRLEPRQVAVVVGPAEHLADVAAYAPHMSYALGRGYLRAAVRLGPGVWRANPNAHGALWVVGPPRPTKEHKDLALTTADLAGRSLAEATEPIAVDLLATLVDLRPAASRHLDGPEGTRGHIHQLATTELLADVVDEARHSLVVRDAAPHLAVRPLTASQEEAVARLAESTRTALEGFVPEATPVTQGRAAGFRTVTERLGTLAARAAGAARQREDDRRIRMLPGLRLDAGLDTSAATGPAVLGPAELADDAKIGQRRVELFALTAAHPHHQLTEPGDVVLSTSPAPAAWVDLDGGNVAVAPARTLRIVEREGPRPTHRLVPHVLAADLRRMPGKDWRAARVRMLPTDLADGVEADAVAAHRARTAALERAAQLAGLMDLVADGVAGGSLTYPGPSTGPAALDHPLTEGD